MESYNADFIERQLKMLSKSVNDIVSDEIKARNRVNISLEEYEKLKGEISENKTKILNLSTKNRELRSILEKIGIPINEVQVIPESIKVEYANKYSSVWDNKRGCRVEFEFKPLTSEMEFLGIK